MAHHHPIRSQDYSESQYPYPSSALLCSMPPKEIFQCSTVSDYILKPLNLLCHFPGSSPQELLQPYQFQTSLLTYPLQAYWHIPMEFSHLVLLMAHLPFHHLKQQYISYCHPPVDLKHSLLTTFK